MLSKCLAVGVAPIENPGTAAELLNWRSMKVAIFVVVCGVVKFALAFLPDSLILALFCRIPAETAAFYYGVPLEVESLSFTTRGVTLAVARSCAATDFFALVASVLLTARILRKGAVGGRCFYALFNLVFAWIITLVVNSLRVIALVPVDAVFPKDHAPIVHLFTGVAFFLPIFAFIWYASFKEDKR